MFMSKCRPGHGFDLRFIRLWRDHWQRHHAPFYAEIHASPPFPTLRSLTPGTVSRVVDKCKSTFRFFPFICILHIMSSWSTMVECRSETILGWDVSSRERSGPAGAASRSALWHQLAGEVPPTGDSNRRSGTEMRLHRSVPCGPPLLRYHPPPRQRGFRGPTYT